MENPVTWTPLHYEIDALVCESITVVFDFGGDISDQLVNDRPLHKAIAVKLGLPVLEGADEVRKVIAEHQRRVQDGACGTSLAATLINRLGKG